MNPEHLASLAAMTTYSLNHLIEQLNGAAMLDNVQMPGGIMAILREAVIQSDWLPPDRRTANHQNYARHLLHGDAQGRFSILSIVWSPGQMSPVHGHHTWCAVGVLRGAIDETHYDAPRAGEAPAVRHTNTRHAGSVSFSSARPAI